MLRDRRLFFGLEEAGVGRGKEDGPIRQQFLLLSFARSAPAPGRGFLTRLRLRYYTNTDYFFDLRAGVTVGGAGLSLFVPGLSFLLVRVNVTKARKLHVLERYIVSDSEYLHGIAH
jgi:hypothetical protein